MKFFDVRNSPIVKIFLRIIKNRIILTALLLVGGLAVWLAGWAFWYEPDSLTVKNYEVKIPEWNPAFENFKIVAISDVHGGSNFVTAEKIREVVRRANEQNADLIVLLGDFVSQQPFNRRQLKMPMAAVADSLSGLRARHGVYAVIGNHDFWYDEKIVRGELERVGYTVLENQTARLEQNGATLVLLGLPDALKVTNAVSQPWKRYADAGRAELKKAGVTENENVVVLTHNPDPFAYIAHENLLSDNFRLMLAGHTHGGQCRFPVFGSPIEPSSYGERFLKGHVVENKRHLFVTPGIGTSILPVRFRVPPEISVVTVKRF